MVSDDNYFCFVVTIADEKYRLHVFSCQIVIIPNHGTRRVIQEWCVTGASATSGLGSYATCDAAADACTARPSTSSAAAPSLAETVA